MRRPATHATRSTTAGCGTTRGNTSSTHDHGAWYLILDRENRSYDDLKSPGKTDYHTMGACQDVLAVLAQQRLAANGADAAMANRVKAEFLHAWNGYKRHAWGHDVLKPLNNGARDCYGESLLMTPVDALDTMLLMGLDAEADEARELIAARLDFDRGLDVKHFEIVIRLLGGLLSANQMTGDEHPAALADDLGTRLLPAFDSPTGMPYVNVDLRTGATGGTESNPAEAARVRDAEPAYRKPVYFGGAGRDA